MDVTSSGMMFIATFRHTKILLPLSLSLLMKYEKWYKKDLFLIFIGYLSEQKCDELWRWNCCYPPEYPPGCSFLM